MQQVDELSFVSDFQNIAGYAQSLMNPLSHYDLTAPVFKQELKGIRKSLENLEQNLPNFSKTKILGRKTLVKDSEVSLRLKIDVDTENYYVFTLQENVLACKVGSNKYITNSFMSSVECYVITNGEKGNVNKFEYYQNQSFKDVLKKIVEFENEKNPKLLSNKLPLPNWKEVFFNSEGKTLQKLLNEL